VSFSNDPTLSESELCKRLSMSRSTLGRLRRAGLIGHFKIGTRTIRYSEQHVQNFMALTEQSN
jgi:excisionase family DNA binding protein